MVTKTWNSKPSVLGEGKKIAHKRTALGNIKNCPQANINNVLRQSIYPQANSMPLKKTCLKFLQNLDPHHNQSVGARNRLPTKERFSRRTRLTTIHTKVQKMAHCHIKQDMQLFQLMSRRVN